tara:strand:+ start:779 stop:4492 length:3714 start_codon:yes stop_codon:yes gene_type:complete
MIAQNGAGANTSTDGTSTNLSDGGGAGGGETGGSTEIVKDGEEGNEVVQPIQGVVPTHHQITADIDFGGLGRPSSTNAEVAEKLNKLTYADVSPNTNLSVIQYKGKAKLESVGIYKTVDLISEGAIAGFCDAKGNLIGLSEDPSAANLDAFKGIYYNDMPVKNTGNDTFNYQRVGAEIRYGIANQPLFSDNSKQAGLSYLKSCQTFDIGTTLPGLNRDNWNRFAMRSTTQQGGNSISLYANIKDDDAVAYDYMVWSTKWGKMRGAAAQFFLLGKNANKPSIFTSNNSTGWWMLSHMREVFGFGWKGEKSTRAGHPVIFHHAITNDNVTNLEINLMVSQLYFRRVKPSDKPSDGAIDNTIIFLIKIGYEDSDHLIGDGGDTYYVMAPITGVATSAYARAYNLPLPIATNDRDRVVSICVASEEPTPEQTALGGVQRMGGVQTITEVVNAPLSYPHSAVIATIIDARSFNRVPKRTFDLKLIKMNVPSNYDTENKSYSGNWTGEFALNKKWSNNPAWVFYDMITSKRYGLSKYGFGENIVDKWNLYSIGKYCDELVETGYEPQERPLDFTIADNGAVVTIQDDPEKPKGFEELKAMFPTGSTISLYKLKNSAGTSINQGFRRRIGARSYDGSTFIFKFNIHKIINPGYVFETYRYPFNGSKTDPKTDLKYKYDVAAAKSEGDALGESAWLVEHLAKEGQLPLAVRDSFYQDYSQGWTLGEGVTQGKVVLESSVRRPVLEARFATNIYLDREQEAYNCLNDLAAVFRGMVYWNNGFVFISNDQARDAIMVFTNANVHEGAFTYSGSSKTTRFTSVLIRYNDEHDNFKPKVEYIEDPASIRKYGYLEKKLAGLGVTSRSQAYRLGKWFLFTNQLETDLVQFKTGIEATYLRPGDVVKIQDSLKNTKRYGGRVKAVAPSDFQLTLDKGIEENIVDQRITLLVPRDSTSVTQLSVDAQEKLKDRDISGMSQSEIDKTRAPQIKEFTITAVGSSNPEEGGVQNDLITVEASEDFESVGIGTIWSVQNLNVKYQIKEVEYRILSVVEQTAGEYAVTAMMYAGSKFGAIDESRNLMATQQSMPQLTVPIVTQTEGLDTSIEVGDARFVPVTEGDFVVGDANEARDEGIQNKKMFTLDFGNVAEQVYLRGNQFIAAWKIQINVGGRTLNTITLRATGTPDGGKFLPAPTEVNIWVGETLDTSVASYTLAYNVWAKTHDSGMAWEELSMAGTVLPDDGGERFFYTPGG